MSWRIIFGILIIAAGGATWGGLQLGNWLVANGPTTPPPVANIPDAGQPVLDANGRPFTAQPPQPLVNGRQGLPEPVVETAWEVPALPLNDILSNPNIALATTTISMEEALQIAAMQRGEDGLQGLADVGALVGMNTPGLGVQPVQPVEIPPPAMATSTPQGASASLSGNWQDALKRELQACSALGFFDRPSCSWAARNKYCEPNNAWGRTPDCPAKSF